MVEILSITDDGLGHCSYVVGLGEATALVVDPARFPTRQRQLATDRGWRVEWTADTHSHADYISGSPELAARGATFLASAGAHLETQHRPVAAADLVELVPGIALRAIATPGHTPDHLAYLLLCDGEPTALFSGGSLLVGALGRTDLFGHAAQAALARRLFHAVRNEILTLPDDLPVYPTHGPGSFCSAPSGSSRTTTIGQERKTNPYLNIDDEDEFVAAVSGGLGSFPRYFRELPEINRRGPPVYDLQPALPKISPREARRQLAEGAVIVDARPMAAFAEAHIEGSVAIEHRPVFGSWLGWLLPLDQPVVLVVDGSTDRDDLMRQCLTVGHEVVAGEVDGGIEGLSGAGLEVRSVAMVDPTSTTSTLVDVRQAAEWQTGHVPGASHIELGSLTAASVPDGAVTLMCGHGERAMTGASLLEASGRRNLSVLPGGPED